MLKIEFISDCIVKFMYVIMNYGLWLVECVVWVLMMLCGGGYGVFFLLLKGDYVSGDLLFNYVFVLWIYIDFF